VVRESLAIQLPSLVPEELLLSMNLWELLATQKLLEMQPVRPQLK
jgi:hypothetical protein